MQVLKETFIAANEVTSPTYTSTAAAMTTPPPTSTSPLPPLAHQPLDTSSAAAVSNSAVNGMSLTTPGGRTSQLTPPTSPKAREAPITLISNNSKDDNLYLTPTQRGMLCLDCMSYRSLMPDPFALFWSRLIVI
jgi:hypothetical protein